MTSNRTSEIPDLDKPLIEIRLSRRAVFRFVAIVLVLLAMEGLARGLVLLRRVVFPPTTVDCAAPYSDLCPYTKQWDVEMGEAQRLDVLTGTAWTAGYRGNWITINSYGLRGEEISAEKAPGTLRIVILGGSAVAGAGVYDNETIPAYLESLIREQMACPVEVINAGIPGFVSSQELIALQLKILPLDPDIVVVYDGRNDVYFATSPFWEPHYTPPLQGANAALRGDVKRGFLVWDWIKRHVMLITLLNQIVINIRDIEGGMTPEQRAQLTFHDEALDVYADNLRLMVQISQANGVQPVLVIQPVIGAGNKPLSDDERKIMAIRREQGYLDLVLEAYPDLVQKAREVGLAFDVPVLDYTHVFDDVEETVYFDDVHLAPAGNAIVARHLLGDLSPMLAERGCTP